MVDATEWELLVCSEGRYVNRRGKDEGEEVTIENNIGYLNCMVAGCGLRVTGKRIVG